MAPYDFAAPDADIILRSSDGKEFRVHKVILSLASPVFQGMLDLPQPTKTPPSKIPTVDVPESSNVLEPFLQYLYPRSPPKVPDLAMWEALYTIADKYNAMITETLRDMLIPRFLEISPVRVYALASHWGFEEEAKTASRGTLVLNVSNGFPEEDAKLMGIVACQKLYLLHIRRREKARALINNRPHPTLNRNCACHPTNFSAVTQALTLHVSTRPWLTAEDLHKEAARNSRTVCGNNNCPSSYKNMDAWFSSILEEMSKLPQTI